MTTPYYNQQKYRRIYEIVDFAVPADHWVKLKESEKKDKYLELVQELKKNYGIRWRWLLGLLV